MKKMLFLIIVWLCMMISTKGQDIANKIISINENVDIKYCMVFAGDYENKPFRHLVYYCDLGVYELSYKITIDELKEKLKIEINVISIVTIFNYMHVCGWKYIDTFIEEISNTRYYIFEKD